MTSKRSLRESTRLQSIDVRKGGALEAKTNDKPDKTEIDRREMVLSGWDFNIIHDYTYGDDKDNVIKEMSDMYDKVKHNFSKSKLKKLKEYEHQPYVRINTVPELYFLKTLPNELTFKLGVHVDKKGFGVIAGQQITDGEIIIPYLGEICCVKNNKVDSNYIMYAGEKFDEEKKSKTSGPVFAFSIDSLKSGNLSRFVNHACNNTNCEVIEGWYNKKLYKLLVASRTIEKGEELLYNYEMEILNPVPLPNCYCEGTEPDKVHKFGVRPEDKFTCKYRNEPERCNARFFTSHQKYKHEFFAHNNVKCEECAEKRIFKSFTGLLYHRKTAHGLNGLPAKLCKRKNVPGPSTAVESESDSDDKNDLAQTSGDESDSQENDGDEDDDENMDM